MLFLTPFCCPPSSGKPCPRVRNMYLLWLRLEPFPLPSLGIACVPPTASCSPRCCVTGDAVLFSFPPLFCLFKKMKVSTLEREREGGRGGKDWAPNDRKVIKEGYLCVCQQDEINKSKKKKKKDSSQRQSNMYLIKANIKIKVTCWINKQHFFLHAFWTRQIRILPDEDIMCHNN